MGSGGNAETGEAGGMGRLHIKGRVSDQAGRRRFCSKPAQRFGGKRCVGLTPGTVPRAEDKVKLQCKPEVCENGTGVFTDLIGQHPCFHASSMKSGDQFAPTRVELWILKQDRSGKGHMFTAGLRNQLGRKKMSHRMLKPTANGPPHLLNGRRWLTEKRERVTICTVKRREGIDKCAIQIEKNGGIRVHRPANLSQTPQDATAEAPASSFSPHRSGR